MFADYDPAVKIGPGRDYHRLRRPFGAERGDEPGDPSLRTLAGDLYPDDLRLNQREVRRFLYRFLHQGAVQHPVRLYPLRAHSRSLSGVERPALERDPVRRPAHFSAERVYLENKVSLPRAAYRGVARHIPDRVEIHREQDGFDTHPCARKRRLDPRVSRADHGGFCLSVYHM